MTTNDSSKKIWHSIQFFKTVICILQVFEMFENRSLVFQNSLNPGAPWNPDQGFVLDLLWALQPLAPQHHFQVFEFKQLSPLHVWVQWFQIILNIQPLLNTMEHFLTPCICLFVTGLTMQATILAYMFSLVERGKITIPLGGNTSTVADNYSYIQTFLLNLLKAAFPHLNE